MNYKVWAEGRIARPVYVPPEFAAAMAKAVVYVPRPAQLRWMCSTRTSVRAT